MARQLQDIVREYKEVEDEHDRQWREAQEAEEAGPTQQSPSRPPQHVLELCDLVFVDDLENWVDRYHENKNIAEAWLEQEAKLNQARATIDQREGKIEELEVKLNEVTAWNTGLRDENEYLRHRLGEGSAPGGLTTVAFPLATQYVQYRSLQGGLPMEVTVWGIVKGTVCTVSGLYQLCPVRECDPDINEAPIVARSEVTDASTTTPTTPDPNLRTAR